ncbi:4825_t:CDS:2 [Funneliformis geosporum]|uniref:4825_t:CDS:1 n=1 Tax=Funneliformis geosporum TaxID=1117311 RepID=A0A9W4SDT6_9GLOM|nr:4825_t:CDS:2 [Funneliformis geosporum]
MRFLNNNFVRQKIHLNVTTSGEYEIPFTLVPDFSTPKYYYRQHVFTNPSPLSTSCRQMENRSTI